MVEEKCRSHEGPYGYLGGLEVGHLPSAQVVILGSLDSPARGLLLPLPVSLPLSVSLLKK